MPDDVYRRSIAELLTRYQFEPDLRDVYVEGPRDELLLKWFFRRSGIDGAVAYPISTVDVPDSVIRPLGVTGNRGRVIGLCVELGKMLDNSTENVRGLIDKDFFEILQEDYESRLLWKTDFSCMECYVLDLTTVQKFALLYFGKKIDEQDIAKLMMIVVEIYLLRAAKQRLTPQGRWVEDFTRSCSMGGGGPEIDREDFIQRLLQQARGALSRTQLDATVAELRRQLPRDYRHSVNGHDVVRALSWYAHRVGVPASIYNVGPLHRALMAAIEYEGIAWMPLFQKAIAWARE
jgi:hypothetical protein